MNVLFAVDDDRPSYEAAAAAAQWLPGDAKVVALHVGPSSLATSSGMWPAVGGGGLVGYPYATVATLPQRDEMVDQAREVASRAAALVDGSPRVESGDPVEAISSVAVQIDADLIVVGTGDRSWLSRLVHPSVAEGVAREAPCSVLVVRSKHDEESEAA